jgi:hypothetical protein
MRILTGILFVLATSVASAQIVFSPSVSYMTEETEVSGVSSEYNKMFLDFRLGYLHASGLFLGGMYSMSSLADGNDSHKGYAVGPTLGFSHYSGFYTLFTYFLMAEQDQMNGTDTATDGMGPQIDIGWAFPVTATFHIGPQLTYRSVTYDKMDQSGTSVTLESTRTDIMPAINLWFNF